MKIGEPVTLATDYAMGVLAVVLAVRLLRAGLAAGQVPILLWSGAFAATALAAWFGGTHHGFLQMMPAAAARGVWKVTVLSTGVASACLLAAVAVAGTGGALQRVLLTAAVVKLAVYVWWMLSHDDFLFVIADYGLALAALMVVMWVSTTGGLAAASPWLTAGVAVSVVAAGIQALGIAPHPHFNHNDLFHVVQMVALYLLYRGGLLVRAA